MRLAGAALLSSLLCATGCTDVAGLNDLVFGGSGGSLATGGGGGDGGGGAGAGGAGGVGGAQHTGDWVWSRQFGDVALTREAGLDVAADGSVYLLVEYEGTIDFGGAEFTAEGKDVGIVRLAAADGTNLESASYGGPGIQGGSGVAVAPDGSLALCFTFQDTMMVGNQAISSAASWDVGVAVLDGLASTRWAMAYGDVAGQDCHDIGAAQGIVVAKGALDASASFGGPVFDSAGSTDGWVGGYALSDGAYIYSRSFGDAAPTTTRPLDTGRTAVAADGSVVMVGSFDNTVSFGGPTLASVGGEDGFVAKLDAAGNHVLSKALSGSGQQSVNDVALDGDVIVVVGSFEQTVDLGGPTLTSAGGQDAFAARLDANGGVQWALRWGDLAPQSATAVAVDAEGNIFVAGWFEGRVDFGLGELSSTGGRDVFIAKLNAMGEPLWSKSFGDVGDQEPRHCVSDSGGSLICAGQFEQTIDFGGGALVSLGDDVWVVKLAP